jgi:hypothetical protein
MLLLKIGCDLSRSFHFNWNTFISQRYDITTLWEGRGGKWLFFFFFLTTRCPINGLGKAGPISDLMGPTASNHDCQALPFMPTHRAQRSQTQAKATPQYCCRLRWLKQITISKVEPCVIFWNRL